LLHGFRLSLEDGFDPAVGKVAHPAADPMLHGHPAARVAEENTLDTAGDQDPVAHHGTDVTRHRRREAAFGPLTQ
jgi:hypothetical protein